MSEAVAFLPSFYEPHGPWRRATARLWREGVRWVIQLDIDGARYTERDYGDLPSACHAMAAILRQRGERPTNLDEDECDSCEEPLEMLTCSQCGVDAFVRTCEHAGPRPIRALEGAMFLPSLQGVNTDIAACTG